MQILVIILSVALSLFLLLAIAVAVLSIKALRRINAITQKAEKIVDAADSVATLAKNLATPAAVGKVFSSVVNSIKSKRTKGK